MVLVYGVFQCGTYALMHARTPQVVPWAWGILGFMTIVQFSLLLCDGEKPTVGAMLECYRRFLPFLVSYLLLGVAVAAGLLLLVVPGVIIFVRCWLFGYLILDRGLGPVDALRQSFAVSRPVFWQVMAMTLGMIALAFLIQTFLGKGSSYVVGGVLAPFANVATAYYYRALCPSAAERAASG